MSFISSENLNLLIQTDWDDVKKMGNNSSNDAGDTQGNGISETYTIEQAVETAVLGCFQLKLIVMVGVLSVSIT